MLQKKEKKEKAKKKKEGRYYSSLYDTPLFSPSSGIQGSEEGGEDGAEEGYEEEDEDGVAEGAEEGALRLLWGGRQWREGCGLGFGGGRDAGWADGGAAGAACCKLAERF